MWLLIVAAVSLPQTDGGQWRAAWGRAKARAELYDRERRGEISSQELVRGLARHLTPQEEVWLRRYHEEFLRKLDTDIERREAFIKKAKEEWERRKARWMVGPPPDMK